MWPYLHALPCLLGGETGSGAKGIPGRVPFTRLGPQISGRESANRGALVRECQVWQTGSGDEDWVVGGEQLRWYWTARGGGSPVLRG